MEIQNTNVEQLPCHKPVPPPSAFSEFEDSLPKDSSHVQINGYRFNKGTLHEFAGLQEIRPAPAPDEVQWINVVGLSDRELIKKICLLFKIHLLTEEDIVSVEKRPKLEEHRSYLFCIMNMITFNKALKLPRIEQVSLVVVGQTVLTFQEDPYDVFDPLRRRIRKGGGKLRNGDAGFLFYSLLDIIVDNYFPVVERYHKKILNLENKIADLESENSFKSAYKIKNEVNLLAKRIFPLKEVILSLQKLEYSRVSQDLKYYLKDLHEHVTQVHDELANLGGKTTSVIELIVSINNFKMNEAMKTLSIIATIFMPLTFISGIYGMNFKHIPELHSEYGYYVVLAVMALVGLLMGVYMKKKKWL